MVLNVLCIHMLGDALSPTLIGKLADVASLGFAIELNAAARAARRCGAARRRSVIQARIGLNPPEAA
jgi:hypothetical protein